VAQHPALGASRQVTQVGIQVFPELRTMDFHRLHERRLILHVRGDVEIGVSDGRTQIFPHSPEFSGGEVQTHTDSLLK